MHVARHSRLIAAALVVLGITGVWLAKSGTAHAAQRPVRLAVTTGGAFDVIVPQSDSQELAASLVLTTPPQGQGTAFTLEVKFRFPQRPGLAYPYMLAGLQLQNQGNQTNFAVELGYGVTHPLTASGVQVFGEVSLFIQQGVQERAALGVALPLS